MNGLLFHQVVVLYSGFEAHTSHWMFWIPLPWPVITVHYLFDWQTPLSGVSLRNVHYTYPFIQLAFSEAIWAKYLAQGCSSGYKFISLTAAPHCHPFKTSECGATHCLCRQHFLMEFYQLVLSSTIFWTFSMGCSITVNIICISPYQNQTEATRHSTQENQQLRGIVAGRPHPLKQCEQWSGYILKTPILEIHHRKGNKITVWRGNFRSCTKSFHFPTRSFRKANRLHGKAE